MECTCVLFNLFRSIFEASEKKVSMGLQRKLRSYKNVLQAGGFADFIFYNNRRRVCVMEAKRVDNVTEEEKTDEDGEVTEEDEETAPPKRDIQKEMKDGFAQALVGMELQNSWYKSEKSLVRGIVSNDLQWTFIMLEYPVDGLGLPTVHCDEDILLEEMNDDPKDEDLARIVGKILAVFESD